MKLTRILHEPVKRFGKDIDINNNFKDSYNEELKRNITKVILKEKLKSDLMINKNGKVVSKKKCLQETLYNRFQKAGINQQTIDEPITLPFNI